VTESDSVLWEEFRNGQWSAFEALLAAHYRPLYQYGRKFTDDDLVKDLIHDLFLHLWDRRATLPEVENTKAYLFKSLRNRIFKNQKAAFLVFAENTFREADVSDYNTIEQKIIATETTSESLQKVNQIISSLTRRQQEIIHLKFYQNLSNDQIATVMEISPPAVSNLLYQTLKLFKDKWTLIWFIIATSNNYLSNS